MKVIKEYLESNRQEDEKDLDINEKDNSISENKNSIEKIKESYANAYEFWRNEEEEKLLELYNENKSILEIANILKRQPSAIISRLRKFRTMPSNLE